MMTRRWSEEEILEQTTCVMAECGERATRCAVLQLVLDELIESVGAVEVGAFHRDDQEPGRGGSPREVRRDALDGLRP
jgi:GAF domain-containing protein